MPCDYSKYHPDWKKVIRPAILERDNHCCKFCGVRNHSLIHRFGKGKDEWEYWPEGMESEAWSLEGKKSTKIILTIMHLDHDISNNDYLNLAAGCQRCHNSHDRKYRNKNSRITREKKGNLQRLF